MKLITQALTLWHKQRGKPYTGHILLKPEDFETLKEVEGVFDTSTQEAYGLPVSAHTDEDIGWWAMEFTGWPKHHPELLKFVEYVEFRKMMYPEDM